MDKDDLCFTSANEMAALISRREISPVELMKVILTRIENIQPRINAFATVCGEKALKDARDAEAGIMRGNSIGLHELFFGQDNLWTKESEPLWFVYFAIMSMKMRHV
jgi:aspartyl-tRNA(Asn)/glutamyl-tRNA(Gln) amidotransferase subunit A